MDNLENEHGRAVSGMFGRIARWYDFLNRVLSLGQDIYWRYRLARLALPAGKGVVLDLAAGTLDVSRELVRQYPDAKVVAGDFSLPMLAQGKATKLVPTGEDRIWPVLADGRFIPLKDQCVDSVTIAFGIRNIKPRSDAFNEIYRVLKPGGRLCVLEFGTGKRKIFKGIYNFYLDKLLPMVGKIISKDDSAYRYLADTIRNFPDEETLGLEMKKAGFKRVLYFPLLSGIVYIHVAER